MTTELEGLSVLLIEDDPDAGELLAMVLESRGASCRLAATGAAALAMLTDAPCDVVLCDLALPDGTGSELLPKLRALPGMLGVPAIAVSGHGRQSDREASLAAGFEKHLIKPASVVDIVAAITNVSNRNGPFALRKTLTRLSDVTGCRYTSLLRFDNDDLVSVWTYDRERGGPDAFPVMKVEDSYCILVKQRGELVAIEDASTDPLAAGHPKQHQLATYIGAPVFASDGAMFGTLCTYDPAPRVVGPAARREILDAARALETVLHAM